MLVKQLSDEKLQIFILKKSTTSRMMYSLLSSCVEVFSRVNSKPYNFDQPGNSTKRHDECERMETDLITFCNIADKSNEWSNYECDITRSKHEKSIARRKPF